MCLLLLLIQIVMKKVMNSKKLFLLLLLLPFFGISQVDIINIPIDNQLVPRSISSNTGEFKVDGSSGLIFVNFISVNWLFMIMLSVFMSHNWLLFWAIHTVDYNRIFVDRSRVIVFPGWHFCWIHFHQYQSERTCGNFSVLLFFCLISLEWNCIGLWPGSISWFSLLALPILKLACPFIACSFCNAHSRTEKRFDSCCIFIIVFK